MGTNPAHSYKRGMFRTTARFVSEQLESLLWEGSDYVRCKRGRPPGATPSKTNYQKELIVSQLKQQTAHWRLHLGARQLLLCDFPLF
jgi:hypothetical protein